ncbi:MAG: AmmeMemoRadiSam system protein B [Holophagaceae bacterium]
MAATLDIRAAAVAGRFYPGDPRALRRAVEGLLADAGPARSWRSQAPKALVVPHAGYRYSGPVAASAYACLREASPRIHRVVLLGPAHRVPVPGLALPGCGAFETPLGAIPVDAEGVRRLAALAEVSVDPAAHAPEHSLEVQLPFLQVLLDAFTLLPLLVGGARPGAVAEALEAVWGGPETLLVVSTDLTHYLPHAVASALDQETCQRIARLEAIEDPARACGASALNGFLRVARARGLRARLLDLRNSGDTAGDHAQVVGYAAFAFDEGAHGPSGA